LKQQQGVFGFEQDQETGLFDVEPLFDATQVGKKKTSGTTTSGSTTKKTTNTQSEKGTKSTTKKTTAPVNTFKGVPQGGF
jgi:hypothetical protein